MPLQLFGIVKKENVILVFAFEKTENATSAVWHFEKGKCHFGVCL